MERPSVPGRTPPSEVRRSPFIAGRAPLGGAQPIRPSPFIRGSQQPLGRAPAQTQGSLARGIQGLSTEEKIEHPGVKPSSLDSHSVTSTGSADLDKVLGHSGIPLGSTIIVEESGATDFANVVAKAFVSQGITHTRLDSNKKGNTHVIVLNSNQHWPKELPGVYKGSSREIKKQKVRDNEQKLSVQNLVSSSDSRSNDLKIAWRYGLNDQNKRSQRDAVDNANDLYKDFNHQFDITSRLTPGPATHELTCIPIMSSFKPMLKQIEHVIQQHKGQVIRLVIPSLLNPSMYAPQLSQNTEVLQFMHSIRALTRRYEKQLVCLVTLPLDLYPRTSAMVKHLELLSDSVIHLEPFNQEMMKLLEKAYHNQPTKIQHGLVHLYKLAHTSELGQMMVTVGEYAFKNGRKRFEIEEWGIPVEDEGEEPQTKVAIDF